jgi:hypothetical protein
MSVYFGFSVTRLQSVVLGLSGSWVTVFPDIESRMTTKRWSLLSQTDIWTFALFRPTESDVKTCLDTQPSRSSVRSARAPSSPAIVRIFRASPNGLTYRRFENETKLTRPLWKRSSYCLDVEIGVTTRFVSVEKPTNSELGEKQTKVTAVSSSHSVKKWPSELPSP